jgi:hypothetical protein
MVASLCREGPSDERLAGDAGWQNGPLSLKRGARRHQRRRLQVAIGPGRNDHQAVALEPGSLGVVVHVVPPCLYMRNSCRNKLKRRRAFLQSAQIPGSGQAEITTKRSGLGRSDCPHYSKVRNHFETSPPSEERLPPTLAALVGSGFSAPIWLTCVEGRFADPPDAPELPGSAGYCCCDQGALRRSRSFRHNANCSSGMPLLARHAVQAD